MEHICIMNGLMEGESETTNGFQIKVKGKCSNIVLKQVVSFGALSNHTILMG